jgi:hypothetical protein
MTATSAECWQITTRSFALDFLKSFRIMALLMASKNDHPEVVKLLLESEKISEGDHNFHQSFYRFIFFRIHLSFPIDK